MALTDWIPATLRGTLSSLFRLGAPSSSTSVQLKNNAGVLEARNFDDTALAALVALIRETGGPTNLTLGAVADGQFFKRDGVTIVGASPGAASLSQVEVSLGSVPLRSGKFTITDATITAASKVIVTQAGGPYTGKGTRGDEAEMDQVTCAATPATGSATVYWQARYRVARNFKFNYTVG